MNSHRVSVPAPFTRVRDVVEGLTCLEDVFLARGDRRGVFVTAYLTVTQTLDSWLDRGLFLQNTLVADYVVVFANAYRQALASHQEGSPDNVAMAWRQSFEACRDPRVSVFQHLLLGINAHINHDLPYAVLQGGLDVRCQRCYHDHRRIDDALRVATPLVRRRIAALYQRPLRVANYLYGRMIDDAVSLTFERARQHSWVMAKALEAAGPSSERLRVGALIDRRAASAGQLILRRRYAPAASLASLYLGSRQA
jgi:hypothetical protein